MTNKTKENIDIIGVSKLLGTDSQGDLVSKSITNIQFGKIDKGIVFMWNGTIDNIPAGWALCDGNSGNKINDVTIPDLRGRFIVGASDPNTPSTPITSPSDQSTSRITSTNQLLYKINDKGGINFQQLSSEQMPKHDHTAWTCLNSNGTSMAGGNIPYWYPIYTDKSVNSFLDKGGLNQNSSTTYFTDTTSPAKEVTKKGETKPFENRPSYYALVYIIYTG